MKLYGALVGATAVVVSGLAAVLSNGPIAVWSLVSLVIAQFGWLSVMAEQERHCFSASIMLPPWQSTVVCSRASGEVLLLTVRLCIIFINKLGALSAGVLSQVLALVTLLARGALACKLAREALTCSCLAAVLKVTLCPRFSDSKGHLQTWGAKRWSA